MPGSSKDFLDMFTGGQMGSLGENASMMNKMNGTTDMMGMPSQGAQELAQRVNENEKTGILQKVVDFLNRGPFPGNKNDPRTPTGSKLIMGPDGQMYDENFIKTIPGGFNNMPEIQRRKKLFESLP